MTEFVVPPSVTETVRNYLEGLPCRATVAALVRELEHDIDLPRCRGGVLVTRVVQGQDWHLAILDESGTGRTLVDSAQLPAGARLRAWDLSPDGDLASLVVVAQDQLSLVLFSITEGVLRPGLPVARQEHRWCERGLLCLTGEGAAHELTLMEPGGAARTIHGSTEFLTLLDARGPWALVAESDGGSSTGQIVQVNIDTTEAVPLGAPRRRPGGRLGGRGGVVLSWQDDTGRTALGRPGSTSLTRPQGRALLGWWLLEDDQALLAERTNGQGLELTTLNLDGPSQETPVLPGATVVGLAQDLTTTWIRHVEEGAVLLSELVPSQKLRTIARRPHTAPPRRTTLNVRTADGTALPLTAAGLRRSSSPQPVILSVYGGFGQSVSLPDRPRDRLWSLLGAALVVAHVRGGGELGPAWHDAGRGRRKISSVTDTIAAAEWLVSEGITEPSRLVLTGASNGGLVAAAAAVLRPDLFRACVLRHTVSDPWDVPDEARASWTAEYGLAEGDAFDLVSRWAPLENIRRGQRYPAFLIMAGLKDTVVPPRHSLRLWQALDETWDGRDAARRPLLWLDEEGGHQGPSRERAEAWHLDRLAFMADACGLAAPVPSGA